jgi:hypothetical protein
MASWKKFKNRITEKEIKVRPIHNKKDLGERKQLGIGIEIEGNEVILNDMQIKDLICYLVQLF